MIYVHRVSLERNNVCLPHQNTWGKVSGPTLGSFPPYSLSQKTVGSSLRLGLLRLLRSDWETLGWIGSKKKTCGNKRYGFSIVVIVFFKQVFMAQEAVGGRGIVGLGGTKDGFFLRCIVIKTSKVLQSRLVAKLVLVLRLHHCWPLCSEHFDRLEYVHDSLITHPFQHDTQRNEDPSPSNTGTASRNIQC